MQPNHYIPLFPYPPDSPRQPVHDSDEVESDFPPCRVRDSTPDPPTPPTNQRKSRYHRSPVVEDLERHSLPSQSHQMPRRQPKREFRDRNILNTIKVTDAPKLSLKRGSENRDIDRDRSKDDPKLSLKQGSDIDRPSKRRRIDEDDFVWLKREMDDIKERLVQIADHQAGVDVKLEEIMRQVKEFNDIEI